MSDMCRSAIVPALVLALGACASVERVSGSGAQPCETAGPKRPGEFSNWMWDRRESIRAKALRELVIPGTHDSATCRITRDSTPSVDNNFLMRLLISAGRDAASRVSRAQSADIFRQLDDGIRYLDIRVCRESDGSLWTCHGMLSDRLPDVLSQVRQFVELHKQEIVIVDFNHFHGLSKEEEFNALKKLVDEHLGERLVPPPRDDEHLKRLTVGEIWESGKQVIAFYGDVDWCKSPVREDEPRCKAPRPFWPQSHVCSAWPDVEPVADLREKLRNYKARPPRLHVAQAIRTPTLFAPRSLSQLASGVNSQITGWMPEWDRSLRNIVIVDHYQLGDVVPQLVRMNLVPLRVELP